jgi:hypothetical protein
VKPSALKKNIQHLKKLNLLTFFYLLGHFCPPGSGSNPDPDPQHCWPQWLSLFRIHHQVIASMRIRLSDPLYLEGEPRDELIRKRNQVLCPHRRLGQSGIHQEDLDGRLLLLPDTGDTTALPAVVDAHNDKRSNYAASKGSAVVIALRIQIFPVRIRFQEFFYET